MGDLVSSPSAARNLPLPEIPALTGASNLSEWEDILTSALCCRELDHYITEDVPEPESGKKQKAWKRERALVTLLIKNSLSKVRSVLLNMGWDPQDPSPKYHYDFVVREIAKTSDTSPGEVVFEFGRIDRSQFDTLAAYQARLIYLRRRLAEVGCEVNEKMCIWVAIIGLKGRYARWYSNLSKAMSINAVTWDSLMQEMTTKAIKEHPSQTMSSPVRD